jgi:hypothetical protein
MSHPLPNEPCLKPVPLHLLIVGEEGHEWLARHSDRRRKAPVRLPKLVTEGVSFDGKARVQYFDLVVPRWLAEVRGLVKLRQTRLPSWQGPVEAA